jgi:hypothetical protein
MLSLPTTERGIGVGLLLLVMACASGPRSAKPAPSESLPSPRAGTPTQQAIAGLEADDPELASKAEAISRGADEVERKALAARLLVLGRQVAAPSWLAARRGKVFAADVRAGLSPSAQQLQAQLIDWQTELLAPIFVAMQHAPAPEIWSFALDMAGRETEPLPRRKLALELLDRLTPRAESDAEARDAARSALAEHEDAERTSAHDDPVQNISTVVGAMRKAFRACYLEQLKRNPDAAFRGNVLFTIDRDGHVDSVTVTGLSVEIAPCIESVIRASRFLPDVDESEKPRSVSLPLRFVKE